MFDFNKSTLNNGILTIHNFCMDNFLRLKYTPDVITIIINVIYEVTNKNTITVFKWSLDGIFDSLPNLRRIIINNAFGVCDIVETLSRKSNKIVRFILNNSLLYSREEEYNRLQSYCKRHDIKLARVNNTRINLVFSTSDDIKNKYI